MTDQREQEREDRSVRRGNRMGLPRPLGGVFGSGCCWARPCPGRWRSGGELVFVDESAEDVAAVDGAGAAGHSRMTRWRQVEAAVGPSPVVVRHILVEYPFQVTP